VTESAFWRFSLKFYAKEGVAPACLALQDEGGADVNLLLFLLFLAEGHFLVSAADIARLDAAIAPWREETVNPLRRLRRRLKEDVGAIATSASENFRNQIKKVELEAERLQQVALESKMATMRPAACETRSEAARGNLLAYAAMLGGFPDNPLEFVLQAFTDCPS